MKLITIGVISSDRPPFVAARLVSRPTPFSISQKGSITPNAKMIAMRQRLPLAWFDASDRLTA